MERNTLMAKCYPRIKDYCREKHGLEFQVFPINSINNFYFITNINFTKNFVNNFLKYVALKESESRVIIK